MEWDWDKHWRFLCEHDAPTVAPYASLQWKGTDACVDLICPCGFTGHLDEEFLYNYECPKCKVLYAVGSNFQLFDGEAPPQPDFPPFAVPNWWGMDVCMDVHCICGANMHYDGNTHGGSMVCLRCTKVWTFASWLRLMPIEDPEHRAYIVNRESCIKTDPNFVDMGFGAWMQDPRAFVCDKPRGKKPASKD